MFEDAWKEYINGLKGFFGGSNFDGTSVDSGNEGEKEDEIPTLKFSQAQYEQWCAP